MIGTALAAAQTAEARGPDLPPQEANPKASAQDSRRLDFSTQFAPFEAASGRISGFIAAIPVSSAATVGLGRFNAMPRRRTGSQDQPIAIEPRKPRRAAVGLSLRF